jgi:hypothetical protein
LINRLKAGININGKDIKRDTIQHEDIISFIVRNSPQTPPIAIAIGVRPWLIAPRRPNILPLISCGTVSCKEEVIKTFKMEFVRPPKSTNTSIMINELKAGVSCKVISVNISESMNINIFFSGGIFKTDEPAMPRNIPIMKNAMNTPYLAGPRLSVF